MKRQMCGFLWVKIDSRLRNIVEPQLSLKAFFSIEDKLKSKWHSAHLSYRFEQTIKNQFANGRLPEIT